MKNNSSLFIGFVLLTAGFIGLMLTPSTHRTMVGMMQYLTESTMPRGITPTTLPDSHSKEAALLSQYCTQCHELPGPGMHTHDEWPIVINRMIQYMQTMHTFHINKPSDQELQTILNYLKKHAQIAIDKSQYTDLDTPPGKIFKNTCSQCHATPEPKQHTQEEWPLVVQRMVKNMQAMGKPIPSQQQNELITTYLQIHAK
ncbi:hypothetical protein [Kaarinaea lacus]